MRALPVSLVWIPAAGLAVLMALLSIDFLLFHTLVELFAVAVGLSLFFVAASVPGGHQKTVLGYLGAGYFWIALLDLMHTVTYPGMGLHPMGGANTATQFWLSGRLLEAVVLLSLPLALTRGGRLPWAFPAFALAAAGMYAAIADGWVPDAYVPGVGLTAFKIYGEVAIIALLGTALALGLRLRGQVPTAVVRPFVLSIALTIGAEALFTAYEGVYDGINALGHVLKVASYWCLLVALLWRQTPEATPLTDTPH